MANWISSKLKAAENILHQIDQQAADSLRKNNERLQLEEQSSSIDAPPKPGVPLKDQFKKKKKNNNNGKLHSDPLKTKTTTALPKSSNPPPTISDGDWTQLLSSPSASNSLPAPRILRQNSKKLNSLSVSDIKRNHKTSSTSLQRLDSLKGDNFIAKSSDDGKESTSSASTDRQSNLEESETDAKSTRGHLSVSNNTSDKPLAETKEDHVHPLNNIDFSSPPLLLEEDINFVAEAIPVTGVDKVREAKFPVDVGCQLKTVIKGRRELNSMSGNSTSNDLKTVSSMPIDGSSDSDTDSGSTSDSESEHERVERRKKRERILAERAAAKAINVIKEKENMVAKLEGEKESLEKILEERAKQQAQEASQLQSTMMETMEAVELEKQKHNNTRMEILTRLAKLETANADLARSLTAVQWNLEVEVKQVAELRQKMASKESVHEELRRSLRNPNQTGASRNQLASKGVEFEREILEAEHSFINDKVAQLQEKARKLEADIEMTRKEIEEPTEVEVELKRRLHQMTDHLIQKQAKVESLSSEKASLIFRIEAVSRLLDENMSVSGSTAMNPASSSSDLESGLWELSNSKFKPMLKARIHSGKKQLGSLLQQIDYIFVAGAVFLKRNSTAKLWALIYLVCLHLWVIYILMSHSSPSDEGRSGAVISLENINNTGV
ncbi:putative Golgin subfamily A member 5 protein [Medicago truncatula]|uniref:Coiled-coil vesicle tethering protein, putative n=2 Tax=Medicago truncatula TaxID=3880 RepID=G7LDC1_MEDTR|nr:golgin candidate 2 isoform X2 [Medicago truncatula]AET05570.1 coiled-coil vesicle tethering protein, putative [Medicago truncatula]RHN43907.1 putative Golgin subfamily A member 5 protein [Medicago truncatula]